MKLTVKEKKKLTAVIAPQYQRAPKKERGNILDQFVRATRYNRCYAAHILRTHGKKIWITPGTVLVSDVRERRTRKKERMYDDAVAAPLKKAWEMMDYICGKRLAPILKELIPRLIRFDEIRLTQEAKDKPMKISPATIDRILAPERKKYNVRGRA